MLCEVQDSKTFLRKLDLLKIRKVKMSKEIFVSISWEKLKRHFESISIKELNDKKKLENNHTIFSVIKGFAQTK